MADPGAQFEAEAAKTLAAAERALVRAQQLQAQIERGATTEAQVEQQIRRAVARDRVAGETIGQRAATKPEQAARDTQAAAQASTRRTTALQGEEQAQAAVNKERSTLLRSMQSEQELTRQYGAYSGGTAYYKQQARLLEQINTIRARAAAGPYGGLVPGAAGAAGAGGGGVVLPPGVAGGAGGAGRGGFPISDETARQITSSRTALESFNQTWSQNIQRSEAASLAMHRHGAFTTEFIDAARRGETTIRELGFQTTATISKFAGWLGAGAAVYGVVGAVSQLYHGAIDAESGVNQLSRVVTHGIDADSLKRSFGDLAGYFNLPVATVTDAVYQMGKVFHSQTGALEASKAVLYSVKVGELDVATATRYLISIVQGAHLPFSQLTTVFDQINQAQNRFGVTIADVEAGMAKATGQFVQSGGDLTHLLAIITTAQRVTGNTGQVIGTAVSRAPNFLRQAANQRALESFGIKASTNVQDVITQAFRISDHLQGARLQDLAAAIFGPQYGARVGTALLANQPLYQKVLAGVQPDKAKGSAERELQRALGSITEQITKIGVTLQRVGDDLAQAGFLDVFGAIVFTLNQTLALTNTLLSAWNHLPEPLRHALAVLVEIRVAIAALRRFGAGEAIAGGAFAQPTGARAKAAGFFGYADPQAQTLTGASASTYARLYRGGLAREQTFLEGQRASLTSRIAQTASREGVATQRYDAAVKERAAIETRLGADSQEAQTAALNANAAENRLIAIKTDQAALEEENALVTQRLANITDTQLAATRRRLTDSLPLIGTSRTARTLAQAEESGARGVYRQAYPSTFETPTLAPPHVGPLVAGPGTEAGRLAAQTPAIGGVVAGAKVEADAAERAAAEAARVGAAGAAATSATQRATGRISGVFSRLKPEMTLAGQSWLGALGDLGFAAFAGYTLGQLIADHFNSEGDAYDALTTSAANARAVAEAQQNKLSAPDLQNLRVVAGQGGLPPQIQAYLQAQVQAQDVVALQAKQKRQGEYVPLLPVEEIQTRIDQLKKYKGGTQAFDRQVSILEQEIHTAADAKPQDIAQLEGGLKAVRASVANIKDLATRIRSFTQEDLQTDMQALLDSAGSVSAGPQQHQLLAKARVFFETQYRNLYGQQDYQSISALAQARNDYFQGISDTLQQDLTTGLTLARNPADRLKAYAQTLQAARQQYVVQPQHTVQQAQNLVENIQAQQRAGIASLIAGLATAGITGSPKAASSAAQELAQLQNKMSAARQGVRAANQLAKEASEQHKLFVRAIQEQELADRQAAIEARTSLQAAQTADPVRQAEITLAGLRREVALLEAHPQSDPTKLLAVRQQIQSTLQQRTQAELTLYQAQLSLRFVGEATSTDPVVAAQATLQQARLFLAHLQSLPQRRIDPQTIINAQLAVRQAEAQLAQTEAQQGLALFQARLALRFAGHAGDPDPTVAARDAVTQAQLTLNYLRSLPASAVTKEQIIQAEAALRSAQAQLAQTLYDQATTLKEGAIAIQQARDDAAGRPIAAARDAIRSAQVALQRAQTPEQRQQAQQQLIQARGQLEQTIFQQRFQNIQFSAEIDRITMEQEINQLQGLLHTMKLTRDQRQQILLQIHQLQQQAATDTSLDLALGNITLPTIYEIRRAIQGGGIDKSGPVVNQQNNVNINVNDARDAAKVGKALDQIVNGGAQNAMRSAGLT